MVSVLFDRTEVRCRSFGEGGSGSVFGLLGVWDDGVRCEDESLIFKRGGVRTSETEVFFERRKNCPNLFAAPSSDGTTNPSEEDHEKNVAHVRQFPRCT